MDLCFEKAGEKDIKELIDARNQSFRDDFIRFGECPGYHRPPEQMIMIVRRADIYKILLNGRMVGDISTHQMDSDCRWIGCLEIIPEYQNRGIGTDTLNWLFSRYPDTKKWQLETPAQNFRNCHFYEKNGFTGIREDVHSEKLTLRTYEKE